MRVVMGSEQPAAGRRRPWQITAVSYDMLTLALGCQAFVLFDILAVLRGRAAGDVIGYEHYLLITFAQLIAIALFATGRGLLTLAPWARRGAILTLAVLWAVGVPFACCFGVLSVVMLFGLPVDPHDCGCPYFGMTALAFTLAYNILLAVPIAGLPLLTLTRRRMRLLFETR